MVEQEPGGETDREPLFSLGQIVGTPGALEALAQAQQDPATFLARHVRADWGDLDEDDKAINNDSLKHGMRLFSAYALKTDVEIWVITESDRSATTILLPGDY